MSRSRSGFTLIELLIVVVIIGILAAVAIPKFGSTKSQALAATLKADLRNLATSQETYFAQYSTYSFSTISSNFFQASNGVTVTIGAGATGSGGLWGASASVAGAPGSCTISVGGTSTTEGTPVCAAQ